MDCICSDEIPTDVRESPRKSDRRAWPVCGISAPERPHYSRYGRLSTGCRLSETSRRRDGEHMGFSELSPAHSCRLELKWTAVASTESGVLRMLNPFRHHCSAEPCSEKHYESSAIHCPLCMAWPTSRLAFFHFGKGNMWNGPLARKSSDVLPYRSFHSMYYTRLGVQHQITRPLTMQDTHTFAEAFLLNSSSSLFCNIFYCTISPFVFLHGYLLRDGLLKTQKMRSPGLSVIKCGVFLRLIQLRK